MIAFRRWTRRNRGPLLAAVLLAAVLAAFFVLHPRHLSILVTTPAANQGLGLAFAAMAQTVPVLTGGLDLSVGPVLALANCVASHLVSGEAWQIALGIALTLAAGAACGLANGLVVVLGRIHPIIATFATSAIYTGLAYLLRPVPGGKLDEELGDALTNETFGVVRILAARHRGRGAGRDQHPGRARQLCRHRGRGPGHQPPCQHALGDADAGGEPAHYLWRGDHGHAAGSGRGAAPAWARRIHQATTRRSTSCRARGRRRIPR